MDASKLAQLLLSAGSTGAISKNTGVSADQVSSVISEVLPQLLSGASKQATDKSTAAGFLKALESHSSADTKDLSKFLGGVDLEDGAKIISHLLGGNAQSTVKSVAKSVGVSEANASQIMSSVAPLLLSVMGQQNKKHGTDGSDLLKSLMSGALGSLTGSQSGSKSGIDAGDVINLIGKFVK